MLLQSLLLTVAFASACLVIFPTVVVQARTNDNDDDEQTMPGPPDFCLDTMFHKDIPSQECEDFTECVSWQDLSCCTVDLAERIRQSETGVLYNFTEDCEPLSPECQKFLTVL